AAGAQPAVFDERAAFALLTESVVLQGDEHRVRVAVVQLEDVDVIQDDTGPAQRVVTRPSGAGVDARVTVGPLAVPGGGLPDPEGVDGRLAECAGTRRRADDEGDRTVRDQAAVVEVQRLGDE